MDITEEIRSAIQSLIQTLENTSISLSDLIPLLQKSADTIDRVRVENEMLRTGDTCARVCEGMAYRIMSRMEKARAEQAEAKIKELQEELQATMELHSEDLRQCWDEIDYLKVDADRYSWLRKESLKNPDFYSNEPRWRVSRSQNGFGQNFFGVGIDAAIDEAMAKARSGE